MSITCSINRKLATNRSYDAQNLTQQQITANDKFEQLIKFNMDKKFTSVENDLDNLTTIINKEKKLKKRY